jgi:FG-GAP-like repeat
MFSGPVLACQCEVSLVADFNGDGEPDLIVRNGADAAIRINGGHASFASATPLSGQGFGAQVSSGDLNGDGVPDLVFANQQGLSIYLGTGDGKFRSAGSLAAPGVHAMRISDLDRDGSPDIVGTIWQRTRGELLIFPGFGNGRFGPPVSVSTGYTPSEIAIADFNLDHRLDIAVGSLGEQSVFVFLQRPQ